jgi:queuosine precursor transporter
MTMTTYQRLRLEGYLYLVAFGLCIPAANWMIGHVGTTCVPNGPCLVPVAPGLAAPSGVLMIGLALVLRDLVQRRLGPGWTALAIVFGALLSALVAPRALVFASAAAFLLSEFADMAVYTPLQKKRLVLAVLLSGLVGLTIDSIVFLYMAFGNLDFLAGQIVGKAWITVLSLPFIHWIRSRDDRINPRSSMSEAAPK